ncbi:MAG TPA: HIT family protein [Candidatus Limnocylindrales bacterium]|nr:HIT family protein [Candidatus Limnocylindrales bacterium]
MTDDVECIFCRIVRGASPSHPVLEDDLTLAFLDTRPVFAGHCLVIPREHHVTLPDLPHELLAPLMTNVQLVCRAIERGLGADGTFVAVNNRVSQSVAHLHVHVVPRRRKDGLRGFFWPRAPYADPEAALAIQSSIRQAIADLR